MKVQPLLDEVTTGLATTRAQQRDNADALLKQVFNGVTALRKARERFTDQLAPDFCLFDYLRTDEYGLSRCLADLLNPQGPHGQGRLFLDVFLDALPAHINTIDWAKSGKCQVVTEKMIDQRRRIDIVLKFENGMIGIENKPWAGDQNRQLFDYACWLQRTASNGNWLLIYLSNHDPDPVSLNEAERREIEDAGYFAKVNYDQIIDWLQVGMEKTRALTVRVFVEELIKFIRKNVNWQIDMSEKKEITESIMRSSENLESAILIASSIDDVKRQLMAKFMKDLDDKLAEDNENKKSQYRLLRHRKVEDGEKMSLFKIIIDENQKKSLDFVFADKNYMGFYWGIRKRTEDVPKVDADWAAIYSIMTELFPGESEQTDWSPWWAWASKIEFGRGFSDWSAPSNSIPWLAIHDGKLVVKVTDIVNRVYDRFLANSQDKDLLMR